MTIESSAWARERRIPGDLGRVFEALANYANHRTGEIHYNPDWIAEEACVSIKGLPHYLSVLRKSDYIGQEEKGRERRYWLNMEREPWAPDAAEIVAESAAVPVPRLAPPSAPVAFQKAAQAEQRKEFSRPPPGYDPEKVAVVEGSDAFEAWRRHLLSQRQQMPFVRSLVTKEGRTVRGVPMPSLFPPREQEQIAV